MTNRIRVVAIATEQARFVSIQAEGSGAATEALLKAALAFMSDAPGERALSVVEPPQLVIVPPKPRRRRS